MKRPSILAMLVFPLMSALVACGGGDDTSPNPPPARGWAWMSGSQTTYAVGVYGTKGGTSPLYVPGARYWASSWRDSAGRLWLFGGEGRDSAGLMGLLNDLWTYDPATGLWAWVSGSDIAYQYGVYGTKGVPAPSNVPGAREGATSWIDGQGGLWLFGGMSADPAANNGYHNDLWRFDPATLEWTWVSGSDAPEQLGVYGTKGVPDPSNAPGARRNAGGWRDASGRFWLFGGDGYPSSGFYNLLLNDLWRFDPATLEWTWISGGDSGDELGVYGTKGVTAPSNVPGARTDASSWIDSQGQVWIFGGTGWGYDVAANVSLLNDLWKFDPTTLEWTWVSGSNTLDQPGVYGTKGTSAPANTPGSRSSAVAWVDSGGKFWLFGGGGNAFGGVVGFLNDLWKFDPVALEWTWVSGSDIIDKTGVYGTNGTTADSNMPGGRLAAVSWIGSGDKLWLFGGSGYGVGATYSGMLNDLWQYNR